MVASSTKPVHVPNNTQAQMRALFDAHGFGALLLQCQRIDIIPRRRRNPEDTFHNELAEYEEAAKYVDRSTQQTIAVIFWYTDIEGRAFETIRALRIGDTVYDASPHRT